MRSDDKNRAKHDCQLLIINSVNIFFCFAKKYVYLCPRFTQPLARKPSGS